VRPSPVRIVDQVRKRFESLAAGDDPLVCSECSDEGCVLKCDKLSPLVILSGEALSLYRRGVPAQRKRAADCVVLGGWKGRLAVVLAELKSKTVLADEVDLKFECSVEDLVAVLADVGIAPRDVAECSRPILLTRLEPDPDLGLTVRFADFHYTVAEGSCGDRVQDFL